MWDHENKMMFNSIYKNKKEFKKDMENDESIMQSIWDLIDEADYVVTHNGKRFDIPKLNSRFIHHKLSPPSTYKHIDTCSIAKSVFAFSSNSLKHLAKSLDLGVKIESGGLPLWFRCMVGSAKDWKKIIAQVNDSSGKAWKSSKRKNKKQPSWAE